MNSKNQKLVDDNLLLRIELSRGIEKIRTALLLFQEENANAIAWLEKQKESILKLPGLKDVDSDS